MYILGIYCGHNATALLLKDGEVIAAASEERFNEMKNFVGFPKRAIEYVLREAKLHIEDIELITFSHTLSVPMNSKKFNNTKLPFSIFLIGLLSYPLLYLRRVWGFAEYYIPQIRWIGRYIFRIVAYTVGTYSNGKEKRYLTSIFGISKEKIKVFDHHLSHAASAYYASPYNNKRALVLTLDGEGDMLSGSVNIFEQDRIRTIATIPRDNSLGYMFTYVTSFLGMQPNEHEYKVMGLAAYVKDESIAKLYKRFENLITIDSHNLVINSAYNTVGFHRFLQLNMQNIRFDLVAALFQKILEDKITLWVNQCIKKTDIHTVILAGGVFMNVKVNQKIMELPQVKELFVMPSCSDESSILGSSYLAYIQACKSSNLPIHIPPIKDIYWGPATTSNEIELMLKKYKKDKRFRVKKISSIEKEIAKLLTDGNIVARLCGRMEFGARALGNRSILADPRNYDIVRTINEKVKNRDFWMPFAPSILYDRQQDYIKNPKKIDSFYMMLSFETRNKAHVDLKAALHPYDLTTRPQMVTKELNPKYYIILKEFEKITGVGGILNTSFNLHGYPIVLGPKQAIDVFLRSDLTHLALENYLLTKNI